MTALTQRMHTYCVGRLLIDLPEGTTWKADASSASFGDIDLSVKTGVSREQYDALIAQRWLALQALKADNFKDAYVKPSQRLETPEKGVIFASEFEYVKGLASDDVTVVKNLFYRAEGYYWQNDTLFTIAPKLNAKDNIAALISHLRARKPDEIPNQPGLCLAGAFVTGYYDLVSEDSDLREEMTWAFELPRNMQLTIRHTKVWRPATTLFQRDNASRAWGAAYIKAALQRGDTYEAYEFRRAERKVGDFKGDEWMTGDLEGSKEFGYNTSIGAIWEFPGHGLAAPSPQIELNLGVPRIHTSYIPSPAGGFPEPKDLPNGPTQNEFLAVWDAVVNSVRVRPIALAQPRPKMDERPSPISREQAERNRLALDAFIASLPPESPGPTK